MPSFLPSSLQGRFVSSARSDATDQMERGGGARQQHSHPPAASSPSARGALSRLGGSGNDRTRNRPRPPPDVLEGNIRFLRRATVAWIVLFSTYTLLVIGGLSVALCSPNDIDMTMLLLAAEVIMILTYAAIILRLLQPISSWPSRLQAAVNLLICLLSATIAWTVGLSMRIEILTQLSMVIMAMLLIASVLLLGAWTRGAHLQVSDRAKAGILGPLPAHLPDPAPGVPVYDMMCCGWLSGRGVMTAWADTSNSQGRVLLRQMSPDPMVALTFGTYLQHIILHTCSYAVDTHTVSILNAANAAQRGMGAHTSHMAAPNPQPYRSRISSAHSPVPPSMAQGLVSQMNSPSVMRIGGIPFYDNSPVDNSDNKHQYFCPICMLYYSEVYKTRCCNNYMCQECSVMYVSGRRKKAEEEMLASLSLDYQSRKPLITANIVDCPYCQMSGMVLSRVNPWEAVKKYEDETSSQHSFDCSERSLPRSDSVADRAKEKGKKKDPKTRVLIGDDFDALRRKIDYTGFAPLAAVDSGSNLLDAGNPAPEVGLPGIAELDSSDIGPSTSMQLQPLQIGGMHSVGEESENFAEGSIGDALLPNEMDFLPKGVSPSPSSTSQTGNSRLSTPTRGETSSLLPARISIEMGSEG